MVYREVYARIHGTVGLTTDAQLAHCGEMLKVYSLRERAAGRLLRTQQSVLLVSRMTIMKPLTLLYRAINLNITTCVSRSFGLSDLSLGEIVM